MPIYTAPATFLRLHGDFDIDIGIDLDIESGILEVELASSRFSYEYLLDRHDETTLVEVASYVIPRSISFDGETIMGDGMAEIELSLFDMHWGAGRETRMLSMAASDFDYDFDFEEEDFDDFDFDDLEIEAVIMPISGDALPDLAKGGLQVFSEMDMLSADDIPGRIADGPMAPGRSFDASLLFIDDTSGIVRQGDSGGDRLFGKGGNDLLVGDAGRDLLKGRGGDDTLMAGVGKDKLLGGNGNDMLSGWDGNDRLLGQKGDDTLLGGNGKDVLLGQNGNDRMFGGRGNDKMIGGGGRDVIDAQAGNDVIDGGAGGDLLTGGAGADRFVFSRKDGNDTIADFGRGDDVLRLDDTLWRGKLDVDAVIDRFSEATDEGLLFDFGRKGSVLLEEVSIDSLADYVALAGAIEIA